MNRQKCRLWSGRGCRSIGGLGFEPGVPVAQRARLQPMLLTVQPQRHPAALPARDVIPPELLPISENSAIGHQSLHCFPVFRKTRPQQTGGKDAFVAGLRWNNFPRVWVMPTGLMVDSARVT